MEPEEMEAETTISDSESEEPVTETAAEGLEIRTDILEKKQANQGALTGQGIAVYAKEFLEAESQYLESAAAKREEILANVIQHQAEEEYDDIFWRVMQADAHVSVRTEPEEAKPSDTPVLLLGTVGGMLLAGVVLFLIEKYRRRRKAKFESSFHTFY